MAADRESGAAPAPEVVQDAAATFGLLSATVRLQLIWLLGESERDVGTLAEQLGHSVATVSHHLGKLKLAGLVRARREGKHQIYYVDDTRIVDLVQLALRRHEHPRSARGPRRANG